MSYGDFNTVSLDIQIEYKETRPGTYKGSDSIQLRWYNLNHPIHQGPSTIVKAYMNRYKMYNTAAIFLLSETGY